MKRFYSMNMDKHFLVEFSDIAKITETNDRASLYKLIEMVIGAILKKPQEYISAIMKLDESVQNNLMTFIQKILNLPDSSQDIHHLKRSYNIQLDENERLNELLQDKILENENLEREIKHLKDFLSAIEAESASTKTFRKLPTGLNLDSIESQMMKKDSEIRQLTHSLDFLKEKYLQEKECLQEKLEEAQDQLIDHNKLKKEVELLRKKTEELIQIKAENQKLLRNISNSNELLRRYERDTIALNLDMKVLNTLKQDFEESKRQVENRDFKIDELNKQIKILCKERQAIEESKVYYQKELKKLQEENMIRRSPTNALHNELSSLGEVLNDEYEQQLEKSKLDLNKLLFSRGIITGLENQIELVTKEKVQLSIELQSVIISKNTLDSEIVRLSGILQETSKTHSREITKLDEKLLKLKEENKVLKTQIQALQEGLHNTHSKIGELKSENLNMETLKEDLKKIYSDNKDIFEKLEKYIKENCDLTESIQAKNHELQKLQQEFGRLQEKNKKCKEDLRVSKMNLEKFLHNNTENESLFNQQESYYKEEFRKLNSLISEKEHEIEKLMEEKEHLEIMHEKARSDYESFYREKEGLNLIIEKDEGKIRELEKYKQDLNNAWRNEMKYVSLVVHEVGLEYLKAGQLLKRQNRRKNQN